MFFSAEVVREICNHTDKYAWMHTFGKLTYSERDGSMEGGSEEKMRKFVALHVCMVIVEVPRLHWCWCRRHIFPGLRPPSVMPQKRFKAS